VLGLDFGSYLTGSILTETIFGWPEWALRARCIGKRDLPAIQAAFLSESRFRAGQFLPIPLCES
jgi:ABC-type dipeptide/oligopeptide/nickel transport system permease component